MLIAVNPGINPSAEILRRYDMTLLPQHILANGRDYDTRSPISFAEIDEWVRTAKEHPHLTGTSAAEMVEAFRKMAETDAELLTVTASRKLTKTHQAALSAARTLQSLRGGKTRVAVVDSGTTDVGSMLVAVYAAEAARAGKSLDETARLAEKFRLPACGLLVPRTLDYLVKGGRASFLRALAANLLDVSPVIAMVDGEMSAVGRAKRTDLISPMIDTLVKKVPAGNRVWAAIARTTNEAEANDLAARMKKTWRVELLLDRPMAATTYLNAGPGSIAGYLAPLEGLEWTPTNVVPFLDRG